MSWSRLSSESLYHLLLLTSPKCILAINNSLISLEFATGYVTDTWDDRMHILITITSCGTLLNQALTKTAFAVTLLKLTKNWTHSGYQWALWFCITTMNIYMIAKIIVQWGKICGKRSYDVYYRLDFCVDSKFRDDFKEGGNGESAPKEDIKDRTLTVSKFTTLSWILYLPLSLGF